MENMVYLLNFLFIEGVNETDISVLELNTLVQGYALDEMGNPLAGSLYGGKQL